MISEQKATHGPDIPFGRTETSRIHANEHQLLVQGCSGAYDDRVQLALPLGQIVGHACVTDSAAAVADSTSHELSHAGSSATANAS